MKRIIAIIIVIVLLFWLCSTAGCSMHLKIEHGPSKQVEQKDHQLDPAEELNL